MRLEIPEGVTDAESLRRWCVQGWIDDNPCPISGSGQRLVHNWLLSAANVCCRNQCPQEEAFDIIGDGVLNCGRYVSDREIWEAIRKAYDTETNWSQIPCFSGTKIP